MADLITTCAVCGAEESLDALLARMIDDNTARGLIADVIAKSLPVGQMVVRHLRLHKPPRQKLRMNRLVVILGEIVADMNAGVIQRHGRDWPVSTDDWRGALEAVFAAVDKGTLIPPLNGNGYLYQVLSRYVDEAEAKAEAQTEQQRRVGPRRDTVQVKGQTLSIGEALQVVHGGKDATLAALDDRDRQAKPMSEETRAKVAQLLGKKPTQ